MFAQSPESGHSTVYYAISYTWGDPHSLALITVNGGTRAVRENCRYVLWQARHLGKRRYYWVDASCINQSDLEEKAYQVQMLFRIFH
jgi:hypothetical protein